MPIHLTQKEQDKLEIINQTLIGKLTNDQAAIMLGISPRQIKRLKKIVRENGPSAVVHKLKNRQSNHHIDTVTREKAIAIIASKYAVYPPHPGGGFSFAHQDYWSMTYFLVILFVFPHGMWEGTLALVVTRACHSFC